MNRSSMPLLALLACAASFACGGSQAPSPAPPTPAGGATSTVAAPAAGGGEIGVPACDEYIRKYEACVRDKVPAAQKAMVEQALEQHRATWRMAASQPAARASLADACQQALTAARASMSAYGCQW